MSRAARRQKSEAQLQSHYERIAAALCVFLLSFFALGQSRTEKQSGKTIRISGRVVDAVNLPLPATTVTLTVPGSASPDHSVFTGADGRFSMPLLPSLSYDLKFTKAGFRSVSIRLASDTISNDIELGTAVLQVSKTTEGPMFPDKAPKAVKPVTICDALADLKRLSGKPVAIAGRLDCSWSLTDHTCYLVEDKCERPIATQGFLWPNRILLMEDWEEGMPKPPTENPEIESAAVLQKLSLISQTTSLGFHKEPLFRTKDNTIIFSRMADVKDSWGAAFGRLFTTPNLKKDGCGDEVGCGGFDGAPAALIMNPGSTHTYDDGEVPPHPVKR